MYNNMQKYKIKINKNKIKYVKINKKFKNCK